MTASFAAGAGFVDRLFDLSECAVLMIGGHGELAAAMGAALADRGANLVFAARKLAQCQELADSVAGSFKVKTHALACNVAVEAEVEAAVQATLDRFGRIDVLLNNAGTSWAGPPEEIPLSGWAKVMDVNLTGAFLAARVAARPMLKAGRGSIITIASTGGLTSFAPDMAQIVPYTTSKAAIIHLTRDLAAQWAGRGVRVNAIAPGQMVSGMTLTVPEETIARMRQEIPMGRLGDPKEIAGIAVYLASAAASYVTGQTIVVDGGLTLV